jgi:hypothetical protein
MRLPLQRVKDAILHPEKDVRTEAVYFFSRSFSTDPAIMPLAIRAVGQFGWNEAFEHYTFLRDLIQTGDTVRWLIEQLKQWQPTDDEASNHRRKNLQLALVHADPALLQPHASEIMDLDALDEEGRDAADEQIGVPTQSPAELSGNLDELCVLYQDDDGMPEDMFDFAGRLVKALAKFPEVVAERVLPNLQAKSGEGEQWTNGFAAQLAGEMRLEAAVPTLVSLLHDGGDWFQDEICEALVKIGTPSVVTTLAHDFPHASWEIRLSAACVLEHIHSDLSVQTCLELFAGEEDHIVRCHLLQSALMNFATEAIEPARQYVLSTAKDPDLLEVRHCLLLACKLTDERFPEFDEWLEDSQTDREFRRQWYEDQPLAADEEFDDPDDYMGDEMVLEHDTFLPDDELDAIPLTFVRRNDRVGRNDPCPCGSGKKFKKCCYGQQQIAPAETDLNHAAEISALRLPKAPPRYPIGTVALYGPDDERTTKIVAAVIKRQGADPILQRWVGTKVKDDPKIQRQIQEFLHKHQVQSVVATEHNMGCPHEEGEDFPLGEDCPFCLFWKGKQGTARTE